MCKMATMMRSPVRSADKPPPARLPEKSGTSQELAFWRALAASGLGNLLLWLAFPPLGWWPLAWVAPLPWLWLIGQSLPLGRKGYWTIWLTSFGFWAALLY